MENALSEGTRTAYNRAKLVYEKFMTQHFSQLPLFPLQVEQLVLFISHCYTKKLAPQTVTTYLSALAHFNKLNGYGDTTQAFVVKRTLQGFQKMKGQPDVRLPITPTILRKLVDSLPMCTSSFYEKTLYKAMFLLAFHAFLRVGEFTSCGKSNSCLEFKAVTFGRLLNTCPVDVSLTLTNFKHHQGKPPVTLQLNASSCDSHMCAVSALWNYCKLRGSKEGPLFLFSDGVAVSRQAFCNQLHISLTFLNFDTKRYKSHSFRIGAASWAKSKGIPDDQIQMLGRWKSEAFRRYIRIPLLNL